jgi:hypothetical protein
MNTGLILIILLLCCCIILLIGGFGFFIVKTLEEESTPTITLDGVTVEAEVEEESTTENYTYDELSKNIKLNIKWSNGSDFDDVTNVYFTRTHGDKTEKKETDANGRKSNTTGNKIQFVQKPGEDMRGEHTIKVTYKLKGQTQEKVMTTFKTNISDDQLTLAADSVSPVSVSYSPATVPFSTEVETQKTAVILDPNPSGFGALFFIPSGNNNAIKIKRVSDEKFLTHSATWGATGGVFYVQSSTGDKRRISTTTTDDGKLLTSVGPALKNYTDMNPDERQKSLFTLTFSPPPPEDCEYIEKDVYGTCNSIYNTLPPNVRLNSTIPQCGENAGIQYKEIEVTKQPRYGGKECPFRGESRKCNIECKDCKGEFKPLIRGSYTNTMFRYYRNWATSRYDVTSPPGPGGNPCPYKDEQKISIIDNRRYPGPNNNINYDYGQTCGKFIGTEGDTSMEDVFGTMKTNTKIKDFDSNIKSYHIQRNIQGDRVWCAVHK